MSLYNIEKNAKHVKEIKHEMNKIENRMKQRKNMNGRDWDTYQSLASDRKNLEQKICRNFKEL